MLGEDFHLSGRARLQAHRRAVIDRAYSGVVLFADMQFAPLRGGVRQNFNFALKRICLESVSSVAVF